MEFNSKAVKDKRQIDLREKEEVDYWILQLDTTKVKLKAAVNAVGPLAENVEAWLKKK